MIKVKHIIEVDAGVAKELYMQVCQVCLASYPDIETQNSAIEVAFLGFQTKLEEVAMKAFKVGKKIGKSKADVTDTKMYE